MWCPLDDDKNDHTAQVFLNPFLEHQRVHDTEEIYGWSEDLTKPFYTRRHPRLFRFSVRQDNKRRCELVGSPWYNVPWYSATYLGDDFWTMELVIPVASLAYFEPSSSHDKPHVVWSDQWGVNFDYNGTRWIANLNDKKETIPVREYNPIVDRAGYPLRYGLATGIQIDPAPHRWLYGLDALTEDQRIGARVIGDVQVILTVSNFTGTDREIIVTSHQIMDDGTTDGSPYNISVEHQIGSFDQDEGYGHHWRHCSLKLPVSTPGPHSVLISILDAETRKHLSHRAVLIDSVQVGYGLWDRSFYMNEPMAQLTLHVSPSANAGRTMRCDLRHRGYEKILHTETATWDERGSVQLSYDLSVLAEGDYVVTVSVEDHEQYPFDVAMRKLPFKRGAVQYTDHGVLLRDGNRIFPIGYFYVKNQLRSDLDFRQEYSKAGFTSYILEWMGPAGYIETSRTMSELDLFPIIGMQKFGYEVTQYDDRNDYSWDSLLNGRFPIVRKATYMVTSMAGEHIFAWFSRDEPNENMYNMVRGYHDIVREIDPYHPTYVPLANPLLFPTYRNAVDIPGPYVYPNFPDGDVSVAGKRVAKAVSEMPGRPVIPVVQTFVPLDHQTGETLEGMRQPNRAELRCMVFHSIINGATGIIYFSYFWTGNQKEVYPQTWAHSKELAGHVQALAPAILAKAPVDLWLEADGREGVQARLFRDNDFVYIIAVNHEKLTQKNVMFALQSVSSNMQWADQCQVMFEDRQIRVKGGSWKDDFGSYGVHVYKLKLKM